MKNKKGFTLIELLAVIVILAIIALIAVPIVLNMIENARKSAAKSSAYGYIQAIDDNNELYEMNDDYGLTKEEIKGTNLPVSSINLNIKGKKPTSGTVTVENGRVSNATLCINNYTVTYNGTEAAVGSKGCENGGSSTAVTWDKYITSSQASGGSTLPANSTAWIQVNTTSGDKELCGAFPNGTVCMISSYNNNTVGKSSDFEDAAYSGEYTIANISQSGLKGYALEKAEEMLNAGATSCSFGSSYLHCDSSDLECDIYDDSGAHLSCYTGINQNNHCEINDDDSYGCY